MKGCSPRQRCRIEATKYLGVITTFLITRQSVYEGDVAKGDFRLILSPITFEQGYQFASLSTLSRLIREVQELARIRPRPTD